MPGYVLFLCLALAVECDFHTEVEEAVRLAVVDDIELDRAPLSGVLNSKVEPLCMALGVDVILHQHVILTIRDLLSKEEVSALEPRLKQQCVAAWVFQLRN